MSVLPLLLLGGASAVAIASSGKKKPKGPRGLLVALSKKTGNEDLDPRKRDISEIITELQMTFGIEPADGQWSPELERAIRKMYREI